jgi:hypothetical protein
VGNFGKERLLVSELEEALHDVDRRVRLDGRLGSLGGGCRSSARTGLHEPAGADDGQESEDLPEQNIPLLLRPTKEKDRGNEREPTTWSAAGGSSEKRRRVEVEAIVCWWRKRKMDDVRGR